LFKARVARSSMMSATAVETRSWRPISIPGSLARGTALVGENGGNILDVHHRRHILAMPSRAAQLDLLIEVTGADAADVMIERIRAAGFESQSIPGGLA
jgi:threonine dehydratase